MPIDGDTPFTPYLPTLSAVLYDADAALAEAREEWFAQVEEFVAACMAEEGFEYVPLEYAAPETGVSPFDAGDALYLPRLPKDRQEVERVGYGVDVADPLESIADDSPAQQQNQAIYDALSETGRTAYSIALYGYAGETEEWEPEVYERSCSGQAESSYPDPAISAPEAAIVEQYASLVAGIQQVRTRGVFEDERTVALNREWDSCMLDAGHALAWPEYGFADPDPFYALDLAIRTPAGGVAGEPQPDTPTDQIPLDERMLVGSLEERVIALADFDCRTAVDYEARLTEVLIDLEGLFVAANEDELTKLMAAIELMDA